MVSLCQDPRRLGIVGSLESRGIPDDKLWRDGANQWSQRNNSPCKSIRGIWSGNLNRDKYIRGRFHEQMVIIEAQSRRTLQ